MTRAWIACGVVGAIVLFVFETPVTLTVGVILLLTFVALGVRVIASPDFLAGDRPDDGP